MSRADSAAERNAHPSHDYALHLAEATAILVQAAADYPAPKVGGEPAVVQASSLGAEDVVISHLIEKLALNIGIFVLDTGALHAQTLALLAKFQARARTTVSVYQPVQESVVQFVDREGANAMYKSIALRKDCCAIRKLEPLERALHGKAAWITGLRREQSDARAEVPLVDTSQARTKINPLAHWSWGDVWHYIREHQVDYNPLHDAFFPSIGCAPCTRAISMGEDLRAGRWWWEQEATKECGLHVKDATP